MRKLVDDLVEILRAECAVHERLTETARLMNAALRAENVEEVQRLSIRYDTQTAEVESLEEKRLAVCDDLAAALSLPMRHANLSAMIEALPPDMRPLLVEVRTQLRAAINTLSRINVSNQILLQESLDTIARTMETFTVAGTNRFAPYGREGGRRADVVRRNIVNKTA